LLNTEGLWERDKMVTHTFRDMGNDDDAGKGLPGPGR
jgi:hypothetical protein